MIAWLLCFALQNLVIQTKSVEFMPFYLSLSTFLMSASFLLYGLFNSDAFVYVSYSLQSFLLHYHVFFLSLEYLTKKNDLLFYFSIQTPNGIGTILGIVQLCLYCYYHRNSIAEETKEPLIVSYVWEFCVKKQNLRWG